MRAASPVFVLLWRDGGREEGEVRSWQAELEMMKGRRRRRRDGKREREEMRGEEERRSRVMAGRQAAL